MRIFEHFVFFVLPCHCIVTVSLITTKHLQSQWSLHFTVLNNEIKLQLSMVLFCEIKLHLSMASFIGLIEHYIIIWNCDKMCHTLCWAGREDVWSCIVMKMVSTTFHEDETHLLSLNFLSCHHFFRCAI
jgi:hypothetical protein